MPLVLTEEQSMLRDSARGLISDKAPVAHLRDAAGRLVYRGQLDDSRPGNEIPVTGKDLRTALDALIAGRPISSDQRPSIGCNIKWK